MAQALQLKVYPKVYFPYKKYTFLVFGAGGTGSYLVRDLARIVGINNQQYGRKDDMVIVDGDIVETKNLTRQNFIVTDVGKNKAEVLSKRYGRAFGVEITYVDEYVTDRSKTDFLDKSTTHVIIGCVDNNKTRHILHDMHRYGSYSSVYIDSGNEEFGGQVVCSPNRLMDTSCTIKSVRIPDIVEKFDIKPDDRHPDDLSCAEHAISAPQNIGTNIMAANIIFGYCNLILAGASHIANTPKYEKYLEETKGKSNYLTYIKQAPALSAHVTYFNSVTGQISTEPFPMIAGSIV